MKKLFDKIRKNNKGFTLVELIIVIAVMAILTVVVAPQYLKYIEKSRISTDDNALNELKHIVEVSYVEECAATTGANTPDDTVDIIINADGTFNYDTTATSTTLDAIVKDVYPEGSYVFKSKKWKEEHAGSIKFEVNSVTGVCTTDPNIENPS